MSTKHANNMHTNITNGKTCSRSCSINKSRIKEAQYVFKSDSEYASGDDWKKLSNSIYKSVVGATLEGCNHLENATQSVLDWYGSIKRTSFVRLRSFEIMDGLIDWQEDLIDSLIKESETQKIHFFNLDGIDCVRVIVNNPTTQVILKYSEISLKVLNNYSEIYFDFLVFGKNEIQEDSLPKETITINI